MESDSLHTTAERFYTLLFWQLRAQMPRPGGLHKYSHGAMIRGFRGLITSEGYQMTMSEGVSYSHLAMGYKADGSKRSPRGDLEKINFQTIEKCINEVARIIGGTGEVIQK